MPAYGLIQGTGAGTASAGATSNVHQAPTSIDRTGATDVSVALNAFIKSVPDGSTITFPAGSRYRIENIVLISDRHNLVIDGAGATFFATTDGSGVPPTGPDSVQQHWPRHRDQFLVYDSSSVTLTNLTVHGANPHAGTADDAYVGALEAQAGVEFYGTTNGVLENCTVSDTYGDLVYIGNRAETTTVRWCTLTRSGRQGITVAYAHNVVIGANHISQIRRSAIDLEPFTETWGVTNVAVVGNTISTVRLDVIAAKAEGDISWIVIGWNTLTDEPLSIRNTPAVAVTPRRHDWYVVGNTSDTKYGAPNGAFWITYTDHVGILNNYQPLQAGRNQVAIETTGSTDVHASGNTFPQI